MNTSTYPETTTDAPPNEFVDAPAAAVTSTLIEFPGGGRANRPQWRKELSERVREIQQRRASEAAREFEESGQYAAGTPQQAEAAPLGLVPQLETPEINPLVAKALERIERARQQPPEPAPRSHARGGGAATAAVVRTNEETYHAPAQPRASHAEAQQPAPNDPQLAANAQVAAVSVEPPAEPPRATTLVVVPSPAAVPPPASDVKEADALIKEALSKPRPRRHLAEIADDALLARREAKILPQVAAPAQELIKVPSLPRRAAAGIIDLLIVAFATSPFAAIMELTSGNWNDLRVAGSLAGVVLVIMFVYLTASVALTGRTWGMALVSLRVADERSGLIPTAGRCARRAAAYMLTLATLGVGLLPALFGDERRAAHDRLSGTIVVRAD
ncbi:MAG: RDD family protein [Acidobacteria bacterium]|nr:RDD family protein [Acidobacteriota bacterium]MCA1641029.1 RDD family protein [Acidobacteriota bacterium]